MKLFLLNISEASGGGVFFLMLMMTVMVSHVVIVFCLIVVHVNDRCIISVVAKCLSTKCNNAKI